jgi:hypothetical protein
VALAVTVAIDFNDEHSWKSACEVDDVRADDNLSAEFRSRETLGAKCVPKLLLKGGLVSPEALGVSQQLFVSQW